MNTLYIEQSAIIHAPSDLVYSIVADYEVGHRAILPKPYFQEMVVEEGGYGAGTVIRLKMVVMGQTFNYHMRVTEPEPGRIIQESDQDTAQWSRFVLDEVSDNTQTRITIQSEFPLMPGFMGWMQRLTTPMIVRKIYREELAILNRYAQQQMRVAAATS
ncbi:MAG: SRPBCC family protein [Anaerolineae bacterium]|nr:SRPBCC family protein [Anaerolineae bacterium]